MVVGGKTGETFANRDGARRARHGVKLVAIRDVESTHLKSADKTYKTGCKEQNTNAAAHRPLPARNNLAPEERKTDEITPNDQLDIVPAPRCGLNKESE